jgi:hypothetical protein
MDQVFKLIYRAQFRKEWKRTEQVKQTICNQQVVGSIPSAGSKPKIQGKWILRNMKNTQKGCIASLLP